MGYNIAVAQQIVHHVESGFNVQDDETLNVQLPEIPENKEMKNAHRVFQNQSIKSNVIMFSVRHLYSDV